MTNSFHMIRTCIQFKPLCDFCEARGLSVSQCTVQHKGKQVDIQSPYRFLNLHSGAELAVVPNKGDESTTSTVRVAVQSSSGRHVSTVSSSALLLDVIHAALPYVPMPALHDASVVYMRRALPQEALQRSLHDIGISSGSAVFRVSLPAAKPAAAAAAAPGTAAPAASAGGDSPAQGKGTATDGDTSSAQTGACVPSAAAAGSAPAPPSSPSADTAGTADALCAAVRDAMFDADAIAALKLLQKLLDNVLRKPGQPAVRSVRLGNAKVLPAIGRHAPPLALLLAAGFVVHVDGVPVPAPAAAPAAQGLLQEASTAQEAPGRATLVLDCDTENTEQVLAVRRRIARELEALHQVSVPEPDVHAAAAAASEAAAATAAATAEFDIFKGMVMSTASRPGRPKPHEMVGAASGGGHSKYARELAALREAEASIRAGFPYSAATPPARETCVLLPSALPGYNPGKFLDAPVSAGVPVYTPPSTASAGGGGTGSSSNPSDSAVVMGMLRARVEESEKSQRFRSQAERDVEAARKKRVYPDALLRVQFPDRVLLQGRFAADESVQRVQEWLQQCLAPEAAAHAGGVKLYVTPPRRDLPDGATLESLSLAPAALVYASWTQGAPPSTGAAGPGGYLRGELLEAGAAFAQEHSDAMQTQLKKGQESSKETSPKASGNSAEMRQARLEAMAKRLLGGKK